MIWWLIPGWLKRAVAWAVAGLLAVAGIFYAGKREARQKAKQEAAEAKAKALAERERIENDVANDPDLAARARRSIVRKPRQ